MPPKRAKFLTYGGDKQCEEIQKFLEGAGIILEVRDIETQPLTEREIGQIIGHIDVRHFLNVLSKSYEKNKLDKQIPPRHELIAIIAADHTLLRRPIIQTARMVTVGCDRKSLTQMMQIGAGNNSGSDSPPNRRRQRQAAGANR